MLFIPLLATVVGFGGLGGSAVDGGEKKVFAIPTANKHLKLYPSSLR